MHSYINTLLSSAVCNYCWPIYSYTNTIVINCTENTTQRLTIEICLLLSIVLFSMLLPNYCCLVYDTFVMQNTVRSLGISLLYIFRMYQYVKWQYVHDSAWILSTHDTLYSMLCWTGRAGYLWWQMLWISGCCVRGTGCISRAFSPLLIFRGHSD